MPNPFGDGTDPVSSSPADTGLSLTPSFTAPDVYDDMPGGGASGPGIPPMPPLPLPILQNPDRQQSPTPIGTQDPSKTAIFSPQTTVNNVMQEQGKPYSGPIVGQSDDARWGEPGWDCSSLVAGVYAKQGVKLTPFTDAAYDQTYTPAKDDQRAGDIIFYKYKDSSQPGVTYPHMGIYLGNGYMADANYTKGKVTVEPILNLPYEIRRPTALRDSK